MSNQKNYKYQDVSFRDRNFLEYGEENAAVQPYLRAVVRYDADRDPYDGINYQVLKVIDYNEKQQFHQAQPQAGDWIYVPEELSDQMVMEQKDSEYLSHAKEYESAYLEARENAKWKVNGVCYTNQIEGRPLWNLCDEIDRKQWEWGKEDGVNSIEDAEKKMLAEHPDYYMGYSAARQIAGGDFVMHPVPCPEYPQGTWETMDSRRAYAAQKAEEYGITLGPKEHDYETGAYIGDNQKQSEVIKEVMNKAQGLEIKEVMNKAQGLEQSETASM